MSIRDWLAGKIAPKYHSPEEVKELIREEVDRVRMSLPITADYDPKGEGYRPAAGRLSQRRDLIAISRDRMLEVAYFMWDHSPMFRRLALMDKAFLFAEPIKIVTANDKVDEILSEFVARNKLPLLFPRRIMWLGILGEQCWPVDVNPHNGDVTLSYVDPQNVKEVYVLQRNVEQPVQVELHGMADRTGRKLSVIREDRNGRSSSYGRLVGECFFYAINNPPNDPRGRSDYLTLFDWLDGIERYEFNYLDRAEGLLNFIWDVTLNNMTAEQIDEWMRKYGAPPEPGSVRAHNENAIWQAVAPDLKSTEHSKGYETAKSFIMGSAGRPDNWFGGGGKLYQQEADQINDPPVKDLTERQELVKTIYTDMLRFQIDQAVLHRRLSEKDADAGFNVNMPEISRKDLTGVTNSVVQFSTALSQAEDRKWVRKKTAAGLFAFVVSRIGYEVDPEKELEEVESGGQGTEGGGRDRTSMDRGDETPAETLEALGATALEGADTAAMMKPVEDLLAGSETLEEFRDGLLDLYGEMDEASLGSIMERALLLADLSGRFDAAGDG
ncbi:MAG: DUF935 family protein [Deltaproteobacteria bacterium]|nr:DUF935 family protein [Deltaproteobacteria bacterium]